MMTFRDIRRTLRSFRHAERGNIAIMTSVVFLIIIGAVALALDTSKSFNNKSRLGDVTDAVALILAKSGLESQADLKREAENFLKEKYPGKAGEELVILSIVKNGDAVTVRMANKSDNNFSGLVGQEQTDISVSATAVWSQKSLDMVLVLDTTLSMQGSRLTSLKSAAGDMVETIDSFKNDNVRMAVVPFSNYVNIGMSNRNKNWVDVPADTSETKNVCRKRRDVTSTSNCRTVNGTRNRDGVTVPHSYRKCDRTYGPEYETCGPQTKRRTWHGCVGSRDVPFDVRANYSGRPVPGLLNARCGEPLLEMTKDLGAAKTTISNLRASGNTYMPSGLIWGLRALTPNRPLNHAVDPKVDKVMVLMTDGMNTKSKNGDWHEGGDTADADSKTRQLCRIIKRKDIQVYTIAYEVTDAPTRNLLQNCASERGNFFNARNASELTKAFEEIANSLNELRISA